ncbi:MAG: hypothetical protein Q4A11_05740, partial [Brachymonas sp.]|nr:hypothetical protein [Brachymonas sp.]
GARPAHFALAYWSARIIACLRVLKQGFAPVFVQSQLSRPQNCAYRVRQSAGFFSRRLPMALQAMQPFSSRSGFVQSSKAIQASFSAFGF